MLLYRARGVFLISLVLCLLTAGGHLYSPDEEIMFRVTESLATRGALDVEPIVGPDGGTFATRKGTNGHEYAQYGVGNSLVAVPLYWAGALACQVVSDPAARSWLDFETMLYAPEGPGRGHALLKRFFVSFTGAFIAAATAALIFLFCRALLADRRDDDAADAPADRSAVPAIVALAYAAGTIALPHARTFFSEPLATLCLLATFYVLAVPGHQPLTVRRAALAGVLLALAFFTRLDTAFAAVGAGLYCLWRLPVRGDTAEAPARWTDHITGRLHAASLARVVAFAAPILLFGAWQLLMNALHFGSPFSSAYADQPEGINFSTPVIAGLYGFLFSVGKSLFLFSPVIVLGLLGWGRFYDRHRALAVCFAVTILGKLLIHSTWQNWAGGWCWGPRHVFLIHAFLVIPAIGYVGLGGRARRLWVDAVLLAGFLVQLYGSSQSFIDYYLLYYRTPYTPPNATVMYGGEDIAPSFIQATALAPDGTTVPFPVLAMPAPINDSIYVPHNSQWYRYAEMWNAGYTDNLWLRLMQRGRGKEQPIE